MTPFRKVVIYMKPIHVLFALFLMDLIISCSAVYNVQYDYDKTVDFTNFATYDWLPIPKKTDIESLDIKRVQRAVNAELEAKGLTMTAENPDFLIAEHLGKKDKVRVTNWGYGYGPYGGYWGRYWGTGGVSVYQYEEGSLILDFVETHSKNLIWRGVAKAVLDDVTTPEKRDKLINEAVQKILKNFPPPSK